VIEYTVTAMPFSGSAVLLAVAARTVITDAKAAADHLERLRRGREWVDRQTGRLRIGARKGRLPVARLVQQALGWVEDLLQAAVPDALATPRPPEGWEGAAEWCQQRDVLTTTVVEPALARWADVLRESLPGHARPRNPVPSISLGGEGDYVRTLHVRRLVRGRYPGAGDAGEERRTKCVQFGIAWRNGASWVYLLLRSFWKAECIA
jgi:uncharacterized protein (DUF885 family)